MNIMAMTIVVAPSLLVTTTSPDAFSAATDIAVSSGRKYIFLGNNHQNLLEMRMLSH